MLVKDAMYVIHVNGVFQLRLKGTHEVLSSLSEFPKIVRKAKKFCDDYGTLSEIKSALREMSYKAVSEKVAERRAVEEEQALESSIQKDLMRELNGGEPIPKAKCGLKKKNTAAGGKNPPKGVVKKKSISQLIAEMPKFY